MSSWQQQEGPLLRRQTYHFGCETLPSLSGPREDRRIRTRRWQEDEERFLGVDADSEWCYTVDDKTRVIVGAKEQRRERR